MTDANRLMGSPVEDRRSQQTTEILWMVVRNATLDNADHQSIALQYLAFEWLLIDSDPELLDRGARALTVAASHCP